MNVIPSPITTIRVSGADADSFLQGQLTQDLRKVGSESTLPAGYCNPKGRLLALMTLQREGDAILLRLHRSVMEATLKRLRMFVMRSKVTFEIADAAGSEDDAGWRLENILAGIPVIYPQTTEQFVPQMVNLDQLGGISYDKGCYTGQEIVARLHYLGQLKRRMFRCRTTAALSVAAPGTAIYVAGETQAIGMVVDAATDANGSVVLSAVLQLSHATSAQLNLGTPDSVLSVPEAYFLSGSTPPA